MNTHRKGSKFRREVELWFQKFGAITTSRGIGFAGDDIDVRLNGVSLSIEAKNTAAVTLAAWVTQCRANAHGRHPVVVAHRKGKAGVDDAYVVMAASDFMALLLDAGAQR